MRTLGAALVLLAFGCDSLQFATKADVTQLEARVARLEGAAREAAVGDHARDGVMRACLAAADDTYWDHVKLNGRRRPGTDTWTAAPHIFEHASRLKEAAVQECRIKHAR